MEQVRLIFPSIHQLWSFAMTLKDKAFDFDIDRCMLSSNYSEEDILRAIQFFEGVALGSVYSFH